MSAPTVEPPETRDDVPPPAPPPTGPSRQRTGCVILTLVILALILASAFCSNNEGPVLPQDPETNPVQEQ